MKNSLSKLGIEMNVFNLTKGIYQKKQKNKKTLQQVYLMEKH